MLGRGCRFGIARLSSLHFTPTSCALYKNFYNISVCAEIRMDHSHMDHGGMDMGHGPMCNMNVRQSLDFLLLSRC